MGGLKFTKMHGVGNDYIYFNCLQEEITDPQALAKQLCRQHFGVGADGIVLILASGKADFRMRMFNADGSEAEMCGNAIRCMGKYLFDNRLTGKQSLAIETKAGIRRIKLVIRQNRLVRVEVNLGHPVWEPECIPVHVPGKTVIDRKICLENREFTITCLSMGNPHCIIFTDLLDDELVHTWGSRLEKWVIFPGRTNVEFAQIINRHEIRIRVWERGTGETLACGTGAGAVCAAAYRTGRAGRAVTCRLPGGRLMVKLNRNGTVTLTGAAETVFGGEIENTALTQRGCCSGV